ncbi:hypothetical protein GCM10012287_30420 [Streptomyces daqingensis]|uniref:DUF4231 domain-containing protein n=1 Tax=Streptomyces daqingensis TaxID=1472640 RepID=A0ABQ2MFC0_9ACTN|nr:DUF4231 domain-containing protein [Streptomyces daqingensis]GGO50518.1 hypothetical protein GCM10012287_30420 [Streptomyces daqingensis]
MYLANDRLAVHRQSEAVKAVRSQLSLLLLATLISAVANWADWSPGAWLAAAAYALALGAGIHTSRRRARVHHHAHRAAAEMVKSLCWLYMAGGGEFRIGTPNPDALFATRLEDGLRELRRAGWDTARCGPQSAGEGQITEAMRRVRQKSFLSRRDIYLRDRVQEQLAWYGGKSERSQRSAAVWSSVIALLTLLAFFSTVVKAAGMIGDDLTGLCSACAAAAVAWSEMRRQQPLTYAHRLIWQELDVAGTSMQELPAGEEQHGEERWAEAVAEVERLVSPQHTDWLAQFGSA